MAEAPVFMIRRGEFKYIHCDLDPPQLFNLKEDVQEIKNLAMDPEYFEISNDFSIEVSKRWNSKELKKDVIATQRRRKSIHKAMISGAIQHWDYNPPRTASQEYVRNHMDWTVAASRFRFPPKGK